MKKIKKKIEAALRVRKDRDYLIKIIQEIRRELDYKKLSDKQPILELDLYTVLLGCMTTPKKYFSYKLQVEFLLFWLKKLQSTLIEYKYFKPKDVPMRGLDLILNEVESK